MMRAHVILGLLCLIAFHCFSQFNDTTNYYTNYTSTGVINKTNEGSSYILNNSIRFNIYKNSFSLNTTNSWIFGEQQDNLTNNDFISVADVNLFKNDRHIYYWGLVNFEKSYSLKTNFRFQTGAGIGYYLIDRESFVLQLSNGLLFEKSDLHDTENGTFDYETLRNSFRLKFRVVAIKDFLTIESSDFLQHALTDRKDYIIKSVSTLSMKLYKWLSFSVAVNYNKLNITKRENLLCNFGLTVERYF